MSAVTRKTSSTVAGQPRSTRTSEGIRTKSSQGAKIAPSSRQGAKSSSSGATLNTLSINHASATKPKTGKKQQTDALRAKEDEYRLVYIMMQLFLFKEEALWCVDFVDV